MKKKCHAINTNLSDKPDNLNNTTNKILKPTLENAFSKFIRIVRTFKETINKTTMTNDTSNTVL